MIQIYKPFIKRQDMQSVLSCLVTDDIGPSQIKDDLINQFAQRFNAKCGTAVREYYRAVEIVFRSLGLKPEDMVLMSPLSPKIYGDVCRDMDLKILYADVEPDSACLSFEAAEKLTGTAISAVVVHYPLGFIPDVQAFKNLNVPVIEDISQAVGAEIEGVPAGSFGDYTIVSLEHKNIITAGGGAVVLALSKEAQKGLQPVLEEISDDMLMSDINASLAIIQLSTLNRFLETRRQIYDIYIQSLLKSHHKSLHQKDDSLNVPYTFPVLLESSLKKVQQYARKNKIETIEAFHDAVINYYSNEEIVYPNARRLLIQTLLFPLYPGLKKDDISIISKVLATLP